MTVTYTAAGNPITGDNSEVYKVDESEDGSLFMIVFMNRAILRGSTVKGHRSATLDRMDGDGEQTITIDEEGSKKGKGSKNSMYLGDPLYFAVHVSCSDEFKGGWGEKEGPHEGSDDWQMAAYFIIKRKGEKSGKPDETCTCMLNDFEIVNTATATFKDPDSGASKSTSATDSVEIEASVCVSE